MALTVPSTPARTALIVPNVAASRVESALPAYDVVVFAAVIAAVLASPVVVRLAEAAIPVVVLAAKLAAPVVVLAAEAAKPVVVLAARFAAPDVVFAAEAAKPVVVLAAVLATTSAPLAAVFAAVFAAALAALVTAEPALEMFMLTIPLLRDDSGWSGAGSCVAEGKPVRPRPRRGADKRPAIMAKICGWTSEGRRSQKPKVNVSFPRGTP